MNESDPSRRQFLAGSGLVIAGAAAASLFRGDASVSSSCRAPALIGASTAVPPNGSNVGAYINSLGSSLGVFQWPAGDYFIEQQAEWPANSTLSGNGPLGGMATKFHPAPGAFFKNGRTASVKANGSTWTFTNVPTGHGIRVNDLIACTSATVGFTAYSLFVTAVSTNSITVLNTTMSGKPASVKLNTHLFRLGPSGNVPACLLWNCNVNGDNLPGIGLVITNGIQEESGTQNCDLNNSLWNAITVAKPPGTGGIGPTNFSFDHNRCVTDSSTPGIDPLKYTYYESANGSSPGTVTDMTATGGGSAAADVGLFRKSAAHEHFHVEGAAGRGIEIGASYVTLDGASGSSSLTNGAVVHIDKGNAHTSLFSIDPVGAAVTIDDEQTGKTLTGFQTQYFN